jgi:hypothetical protein
MDPILVVGIIAAIKIWSQVEVKKREEKKKRAMQILVREDVNTTNFTSETLNTTELTSERIQLNPNPNANTGTELDLKYTFHVFQPESDRVVEWKNAASIGDWYAVINQGNAKITLKGAFVDSLNRSQTGIVLKPGQSGMFFWQGASYVNMSGGYNFAK